MRAAGGWRPAFVSASVCASVSDFTSVWTPRQGRSPAPGRIRCLAARGQASQSERWVPAPPRCPNRCKHTHTYTPTHATHTCGCVGAGVAVRRAVPRCAQGRPAHWRGQAQRRHVGGAAPLPHGQVHRCVACAAFWGLGDGASRGFGENGGPHLFRMDKSTGAWRVRRFGVLGTGRRVVSGRTGDRTSSAWTSPQVRAAAQAPRGTMRVWGDEHVGRAARCRAWVRVAKAALRERLKR